MLHASFVIKVSAHGALDILYANPDGLAVDRDKCDRQLKNKPGCFRLDVS
jgi:hypothetical protein